LSAPARGPSAPAKLNLYLDVLGRRDDGYHDLETLFLPLTWGDDVSAEVSTGERTPGATPEIELHVEGPDDVPRDERNLVWQAVLAFDAALSASACEQRVERVLIRLRKRVPAGAGLGGGSSDAAAVLRALSAALPDAVSDEALASVHRSLGADVPFFRHGRPAVGRGRGDELEGVEAASGFDIVLILPNFGCETATVFRSLSHRVRAAPADGLARAVEALRTGNPAAMRTAHYNALGVPAMAAYPLLLRFTSDVERRLGRPPGLSGSGSTLFDIPDAGEDDDVLRKLEGINGSAFVVRT